MHVYGMMTARLVISAALLCLLPYLAARAGNEQGETQRREQAFSALDRLAVARDYKTLAAKLLNPAGEDEARAAVEWSAKAPALDGPAMANVLWSKLFLNVAMAHPDGILPVRAA